MPIGHPVTFLNFLYSIAWIWILGKNCLKLLPKKKNIDSIKREEEEKSIF